MTAFTLFGLHLFTTQSWLGDAAVMASALSLAVLAWSLRVPVRAAADAAVMRRANTLGLAAGVVASGAMAVGLRVQPLSFSVNQVADTSWGAASFLTLACAVGAFSLASSVASRVLKGKVQTGLVVSGATTDLAAALQALETLRTAVAGLQRALDEAQSRAGGQADPAVLEEYAQAAAAIGHKLMLGRELEAAASSSVLRLACRAPLQRVLSLRPDVVIARVGDEMDRMPLPARVQDALSGVETFLQEVRGAREVLEREASGAPGSTAARIGMTATTAAAPCQSAVEEISFSYGRVQHRLQALKLRLSAETDAGMAVKAALALSRPGGAGAEDSVTLASEIADAEEAARLALQAAADEPVRVSDAVARAAAALAQEDEQPLHELLHAMREVSVKKLGQ